MRDTRDVAGGAPADGAGAGGGPAGGAVTGGDRDTLVCDACLRRAQLVGHLAAPISERLQSHRRRAPGLLALPDEELIAAACGEDGSQARRFLDGLDLDAARERLGAAGLSATCRHMGPYPSRLFDLCDPPAVLYFTGPATRVAALTSQPVVTVVGSRRASPYGLEVAYELGRCLGAAGIVVVSGLALGIDGAAHRGVLDAGGGAVAVLASGANVPYPRTHRRLYTRVRETGLVISEMPAGTRAFRWSFPARNRIMAALAELTVVVEAAESSGSLITADVAAELGRGVGAVPGHTTARVAAGTNGLLREGARVIRGAEDVLDELFGAGGAGSGSPRCSDSAGPHGGAPPGRSEAASHDDGAPVGDAAAAGGVDGADAGMQRAARNHLDPTLEPVLEAVEAEGDVDSIGAASGLPAREVRAALGRLEAEGYVASHRFGWYVRTTKP